jgi:hypothetical protein
VEENTDFRIELLPYCPVDNGADVSAWDIDEISVFGGCYSSQNNMSSIEGTVMTNDSLPISGVEMQLSENSSFSEYEKKMTDEFGFYSFDHLMKGHSYFIRGYKNDDVLNGVSSLDIIQIQKHLLGITPFTSLYQYIAADVNHSGTITVMDLFDLRKLLLGLTSSFPHNTSWRFGSLPQDMTGINISSFNEVGSVEYLERDTQIINFVGIKIGDLNGDVK